MLSVRNVSKYFGGVCAVDDCSFSIKEGKITALIGPNGSGKSTLFNLISGVFFQDSGQIFFDGIDLGKMSVDARANRGLSRMFQSSRVFRNLSVKDNLRLALFEKDVFFWTNFFGFKKLSGVDEDRIRDSLKFVGLEAKSDSLCSDLSFGQKRLVEISMCLLRPHKLLMLDEPVAGVTPLLRTKIANMLLGLKKQGETILLIEHDMNFTLGIADEVIVLDEGKVIAKGTPLQIKNNPKVLKAYLGE
jgi:branched-chain amino acid transport system permease protein